LIATKKKNRFYFTEPISDFIERVKENIKAEWHQQYGHLNMFDLKKLSSQNLILGTLIFLQQNFLCKVCVEYKQTTNPFLRYSNTKCQELLELVSSDICGPMRTKSLSFLLLVSYSVIPA